jgi:hypothetical protein
MLSAERQAAAERALDDLESQRGGAIAQVATTFDVGGGQSRDSALYFLEVTAPAAIDSLRRQLGRIGDDRWSQWVSDARALQRNIASIGGSTDEWGLSSVLYAAAAQTGSDVQAGVAELGQGSKLGAGVFTFAVLAYVAWKVLR